MLSLRSQKSACFIALICLSPPAAAQVKADRIIIVKSGPYDDAYIAEQSPKDNTKSP